MRSGSRRREAAALRLSLGGHPAQNLFAVEVDLEDALHRAGAR